LDNPPAGGDNKRGIATCSVPSSVMWVCPAVAACSADLAWCMQADQTENALGRITVSENISLRGLRWVIAGNMMFAWCTLLLSEAPGSLHTIYCSETCYGRATSPMRLQQFLSRTSALKKRTGHALWGDLLQLWVTRLVSHIPTCRHNTGVTQWIAVF